MNIEAIENNRIIVDLSLKDMTELDITFEDMDYSNIETRRVIHIILDKARDTLHKDIDPTSRLIVEAIPKLSGGCLLFFTIMDSASTQRLLQIKKESRLLTYEFESIDNLFDLASVLNGNFPFDSQLYSDGKKYRLIIQPSIGFSDIKQLISEYGALISKKELSVAHIKEHWKVLIRDSAIEKLYVRKLS